jgi:hypothetical protein
MWDWKLRLAAVIAGAVAFSGLLAAAGVTPGATVVLWFAILVGAIFLRVRRAVTLTVPELLTLFAVGLTISVLLTA